MYNLILPRRVEPFTRIAELVANNFKILVRPGDFRVSDRFFKRSNDPKYQKTHPGSSHELVIYSEFLMASNSFGSFTNSERYILTVTKLLPVENFLHEASQYFTKNSSEVEPTDFYKYFREWINNEIFKKLEKCNKTALLLPEYYSKQFARDLKRANKKHVFVGLDKYAAVSQNFLLKVKFIEMSSNV